MTPAGRRYGWATAAVLATATAAVVWTGPWPETEPPNATTAAVARVIDGDTVEMQDSTKVRLIGIDTPETNTRPDQCYGPEATSRTRELIEGKQVTLASDPTQDDVDRYQRSLRYIEVSGTSSDASGGGDTIDVQLALIEGGFAREATFDGPYQRQADYRRAEQQAKVDRQGIWGDPQTKECAG